MLRKKQANYTSEFKSEALKLVAFNKNNIRQTAQGLGISVQTLHNWVSKAKKEQALGGSSHADLSSLHLEIQALKKELKQTQIERDILKKATAYFAKESQ